MARRHGMVAAAALIVLPGCLHEEERPALPALPEEALEELMAGKSATGRRGATVFGESGCLRCHTYAGLGTESLGAPDLTDEGELGRGITWQLRHLRNPGRVVPGSAMPSFATLGEESLRALAVFLEESRN